jgi:5,10-methenyltetrahydromethanopterin hydrogenase
VHNSRFSDYLHLIYPNELEVKVTTDTQKSASYLDLHLDTDSEGPLRGKCYDIMINFNDSIMFVYVSTFQ